MTLGDKILYLSVGIGAALFVSFTVAPKRTRKTVDYLLNTARAILNLRKGETTQPVEVPDFETHVIPKVPNPRESGEKKS